MPDESQTITLHHDPKTEDGNVVEFYLENTVVVMDSPPRVDKSELRVFVCKHCGVLYDARLNGMCAARLYEQMKTLGSPVRPCPTRWVPGVLSRLPRTPIPCALWHGHEGDHLFPGVDPKDIARAVVIGDEEDDIGD